MILPDMPAHIEESGQANDENNGRYHKKKNSQLKHFLQGFHS